MTRNKILITGGVSLIGKYIVWKIADDFDLHLTYHKSAPQKDFPKLSKVSFSKLDITQKLQVEKLTAKIKPHYVIHLAALSNIDYCESNPDLTEKVNIIGTKNIISACTNNSVNLIYFSSIAVFDGKKGKYRETDRINPVTVYGRTKAAGESYLHQINIPYLIIRCTTALGWPPTNARENNINYYLKELSKNKPIFLVKDRYFNPIYARRIGEAIKLLIKKDKQGIYHLAGKDQITRYQLIKKLARIFKVKPAPKLVAVNSDFFPHLVHRPKYGCLDSSKIQKLGLNLQNLDQELQLVYKEKFG